MSWSVNVFNARESIDKLIATRPSRKQIGIRIASLRRLIEDSERFFPLPSLVASLEQDIERLRGLEAQHA